MQKFSDIDCLRVSERQIPAETNLQLGKLRRGLHQLRRAVQWDLLIPAVPVSFAAARCQLQDDVLIRLEFRITAELTGDAEICLSLAEHRLLHVGLHLFETLAEPAFRIIKAPDCAVIQNAFQIRFLCQVVDLGWNGCFCIVAYCFFGKRNPPRMYTVKFSSQEPITECSTLRR